MPRYEYKCGCGWHGLLIRPLEECAATGCPACGQVMPRTYTAMGMPYTQSPLIDNREFNNGLGVFDRGLGEVVMSRKHRREIMERKGLQEVSKYDRDVLLKDPEIKPPSAQEATAQFDEAVAMTNSGEWKKGLSEKRIQEIEGGRRNPSRDTTEASGEEASAKVESREPFGDTMP